MEVGLSTKYMFQSIVHEQVYKQSRDQTGGLLRNARTCQMGQMGRGGLDENYL